MMGYAVPAPPIPHRYQLAQSPIRALFIAAGCRSHTRFNL